MYFHFSLLYLPLEKGIALHLSLNKFKSLWMDTVCQFMFFFWITLEKFFFLLFTKKFLIQRVDTFTCWTIWIIVFQTLVIECQTLCESLCLYGCVRVFSLFITIFVIFSKRKFCFKFNSAVCLISLRSQNKRIQLGLCNQVSA